MTTSIATGTPPPKTTAAAAGGALFDNVGRTAADGIGVGVPRNHYARMLPPEEEEEEEHHHRCRHPPDDGLLEMLRKQQQQQQQRWRRNRLAFDPAEPLPPPPPPQSSIEAASVVVPPVTEEEDRARLMRLLIEHRSEFPSRIRPVIAAAADRAAAAVAEIRDDDDDDECAVIFIDEVRRAVRALLLGTLVREKTPRDDDDEEEEEEEERAGRRRSRIVDPSGSVGSDGIDDDDDDDVDGSAETWHGLDETVDTEDQAELAIRLFPDLLMEASDDDSDRYRRGDRRRRRHRRNDHHRNNNNNNNRCDRPLYRLTSSSRAVAFVPLFWRVGFELGSKQLTATGTSSRQTLLRDLLDNPAVVDRNNNNNNNNNARAKTATEGEGLLAEKCLGVLARLRETGLVTPEDLYEDDLLLGLLARHGGRGSPSRQRFLERRMRLLIDWNPSLLRDCGRGSSLLQDVRFYYYYDAAPIHRLGSYHGCGASLFLRVFELVLELGLEHFPTDLGFAFHESAFVDACGLYGAQRVGTIVRDKLLLLLGCLGGDAAGGGGESGRLRDLVLAAATDDEISLDGVYTLVRFDPVAFIVPPPPS